MHTDPQTSRSAQLDRIEDKLSKMDEKLDNHLERIAVSETKIAHNDRRVDGFIKIVVATFLAVVGFLGTVLFSHLPWGK